MLLAAVERHGQPAELADGEVDPPEAVRAAGGGSAEQTREGERREKEREKERKGNKKR